MSGAERCVNPRCDDYREIHEGSCFTGPDNHLDEEIYVPMGTPVRPTPLAGETARLEIKQKPPLPLFALFNPDGSKLKAQLLKLDDEDGVTYHVIAAGLHEDLVGIMDYLHEGEAALHG